MIKIILILIFFFFRVSHEINYNNEKLCYYMNILKKQIFFNCYLFSNTTKNGCCGYFVKKKEGKSSELYSLKDLLKNSLEDKDINEIRDLFPMINDKLLILNNFDGVSNGEIKDIDNLLIEFNNKYFNLSDIKVKILNSDTSKYDSYFNYVKDENEYLKKKVEILRSSPFNKTCFKSIEGNKCDNLKKNFENNNDTDEELLYDLDETLNDNENSTFKKSDNEMLYNMNENEKTVNNEQDGKSFYNVLKKFNLVNTLSQNPMKIIYKYFEFKQYLASSKEKLKKFFVREYDDTTQKIISVLSNDLKKSNEVEEENINKGFLSRIFDTIFSLFYFPQKNIEL